MNDGSRGCSAFALKITNVRPELALHKNKVDLTLDAAIMVQTNRPNQTASCVYARTKSVKDFACTQFMKDYRNYYFRQDVPASPSTLPRDLDRIRPEANLWGIGAIMWSLTTPEEVEILRQRVNDILPGTRPAYRTFNGHDVIERALAKSKIVIALSPTILPDYARDRN
ncbi:uncharacterized protein Z518_01840 [Rhinocladiella mackenziei CBS 650.93]|uniref:Uncharacterized protein n=1 Tax=Rhinocladiella mackenziei CBS 650.93 TaxID=1442369 RepID=A0A0D2FY13_9EURO|nr:uncharacterized protein Z518_01840 [Rhinocladiella mackenziei CBS 650.93]KIX07187.1 hypothetical protein Z518_01840 [Rhinocladiella mackenziei CBS 650.93]